MADAFQGTPQDENDVLSLVKCAKAGNESAFSDLAERFGGLIRFFICPLSIPEEDQSDLFQEGLISLYKAVLLYDPSLSSFSTFAGLCIRSAIRDALRKYNKDHLSSTVDMPAEEIPDDASPSPERVLLGKEELSALLHKVDTLLSTLERKVLGLHLQGMKAQEIASRIGKDQKSVENTLFRLRRKLSQLS